MIQEQKSETGLLHPRTEVQSGLLAGTLWTTHRGLFSGVEKLVYLPSTEINYFTINKL